MFYKQINKEKYNLLKNYALKIVDVHKSVSVVKLLYTILCLYFSYENDICIYKAKNNLFSSIKVSMIPMSETQ